MDNLKKSVMTLDMHDAKGRQKAISAVANLKGIDSIEVDIKTGKMTVIGAADPEIVAGKLKKRFNAKLSTVAPFKEEKKDGDKKDGDKKDGDKKDDDKKDGDKPVSKPCPYPYAYPYPYPYPHLHPHPHPQPYQYQYQHQNLAPTYYNARSIEEDPNSCVIC